MRYAAFLRAVNLGRNRRVSGAELRAIFEKLGLEDVASFRTSGNLVFEAPRDMTAQIEKALESELGYDVGVYLRTAAELREIASHDPFKPAETKASKGKLQVSLLSDKPTAAKRKQVLALATDQDRLAFGKRELYWLPSGGTMESELDRKAIDALLGPTTMRTKGTVEQLAAKYFAT
ncbi:MAG TPA: DUF1697 domain-containing protein [Thermoleophilaceae bacterium]|nr:DUF1697 domain-containing protein [Thermoleophilaceae bacterium]